MTSSSSSTTAATESRNAIEMTGLSSSKESKRGPSSPAHNSKDGGGMSKRAPSYDASDEEAGLLGSKRPVGRHRIVPRSLREVVADDDEEGLNDSNRQSSTGSGSRSSSSKPTLEEQRRASRRAEVAMYASENFLSFVDFFQLFGLLWAIMFHVPWPTEWVMYTSWTLFANLDGSMYWFYHNYTASLNRSSGTPDPHFNLWGEIRGYGLLYSGIWATVCLTFIVLVICIHSTKQSFNVHKCWQRPVLRRFIQWCAYVFYLPFGVAFLRPFACSYSEFIGATVMDHDTTQECWRFEFTPEGFHGIACVLIGVVAAMYLLYAPAWTIVHVKRHVVFEGRQRHEHFVQQKQCEYVLGINSDFVNESMAYFSSFRQPMTSFRFVVFVRKLLLLLVYIFARNNIVTQLGLLWGVQLVWCIAFTAFPPFRVRSSNVIMLVLDYTYLALGLLSLLRGGGTNSDAFVDSYFQIILVGVVGTGVGLALLVWLVDGAFLTCNPVQYRVEDPDAMTLHWVEEIRRVDETLFELNAKPLELVDIDELRSELKAMFECFHEARESKHILRYTLQNCMEDVQATVDESENLAMYPNPILSSVVPKLRAEIEHQSEIHALVPPRSRRWLRKLESVRLFQIGSRGGQSDSDDDFADWQDSEVASVGNDEHAIADLAAQTQDALIPPVDMTVANGLKKKWKAHIQRWKQSFFKNNRVKPTIDDMWEIDDWRKNYLLLKEATRA